MLRRVLRCLIMEGDRNTHEPRPRPHGAIGELDYIVEFGQLAS